MPRPELGSLAKGQTVLVRNGARGERAEMTVVTLGPKWVGLVALDWVGTDHVRKFLLADQGEGEPGQRIGSAAYFATPEQAKWDDLVTAAYAYVRDVAGLDVRRGDVPFAGEDGILKLAHILGLMESSWRPESS